MTHETAMAPSDFWMNRDVLRKGQEIYDAVRKKLQSFHTGITRRANRAEMKDVARKLDILRQGTFCFDREEQTAGFLDHLCISAGGMAPRPANVISNQLRNLQRRSNSNRSMPAFDRTFP